MNEGRIPLTYTPAMRMRLIGVASLIALLVLGGVAAGHTQRKDDPNDSPDRLDIKRVALSHTARRIKIDIRTWESWPSRALERRTFYFVFDTKDDNAVDYGMNILRSGSEGLQCILGREPNGDRIGTGRVSRDGDSHIACSFLRRDIEARGSKTIRWAGAMYNLDTIEVDAVPDSDRMFRHSL